MQGIAVLAAFQSLHPKTRSPEGEPIRCHGTDGDRAARHQGVPIETRIAQRKGDWHKDKHDGELAGFHPYVESNERQSEIPVAKSEVGEDAGETQAVDQSE